MYKILTASSDNYITNKVISNFRVTDSNVGSGGTLDLFKLYNETNTTSTAATASISFSGSPTNGENITIIDSNGLIRTYTAASSTDASSREFDSSSNTNAAAALKVCIDSSSGHNGTITVTDDGSTGKLTLVQTTKGIEGNTRISSILSNATVKSFSGGKGSSLGQVELSRALIKFDLSEVRKIHQNKCSVNHSSFKAILKLFDIYGGQTTPSNFNLRVYPLSQSFDEGKGRDVVRYSDLGASNFVTASISNGDINTWNVPGANSAGSLNDLRIDIIENGSLGKPGENENLYADKYFESGKEDLEIDVTKIVSGTIANLIPDHGFRISFTPEIESDRKTYFVKRFASRNASDPTIRPQLVIKYNDVIHDHHKSLNFNITGSLFLNNIVSGKYRNVLSGSTTNPGALEEISGNNCILLKVYSGSYTKYVTGSSYSLGDVTYPGIYSASFLINKFDSKLVSEANKKDSLTFKTVWTDFSEKMPIHSGSFTVDTKNTTSFSNSTKRLIISITNLRKTYYRDSIARFRVFVEDVDKVVKYVKIPKEKSSESYYNMKYAVVDVDTGKYIIPFQKDDMSTTLSVDSDGMYFDLDMKSLPPKRIYKLVFLLEDMGEERIFTKTASIFRVI
tara:strand:- start:4698 stop:6566 length:1869 start_codon:yes stop_codon:yes gene_type:complete